MSVLEGNNLIQQVRDDPNLTWTTTYNQHQVWCVIPPCTCNYTYGRFRQPHEPSPLPEYLYFLRDAANDIATNNHDGLYSYKNASYNVCNVALYTTKNDNLPWHNDNDRLFDTLSPLQYKSILSFSVGATRQFLFEQRNSDFATRPYNCSLSNGDICLMERATQLHFNHCLPATSNDDLDFNDYRIAFTFRHIAPNNHHKDCTMHQPR